MKRGLTICCAVLAILLFYSDSNAQTEYWKEGFEDTTFVSSPGPSIATDINVATGTWVQYYSYRTKSSTGNPVGTYDMRIVKPATVVTAGGSGFSYFVTPVLSSGVGVVSYYEGRGSRAITIEKSTDGGTTWTLVEVDTTVGKAQNPVTVNDAKANRVRFSNQAASDADIDELSVTNYTATAVENKAMPLKFALEQNYPNPFNPTTNISFCLDKSSEVKLSVFNMIGQEVAILLNRNLSEGQHELSFNAANLPSGIYLYCLTTGTQTVTRKMTLLK